ncbi:hypothetical protein [Pyxidicoccus xibeiensis]|uniref:hypothetical protein n=1 Tax=Pyxidicoccus xibeiensis TaxID=2906759 RepID=UPI0020A71C19|nr:hypothetical protein [Pyxidicoccus xibeiensis]MCP3135956.1 hypothetical protein [Pyxidicoccus xibeiensis]
MNMKTLLISLAFGGLLSACGGLPEEELPVVDESLGSSEQALCETWEEGGRRCTFKCTANGPWLVYAAGQIAYGQCRSTADAFCKGDAYAACWSI